MIASNTRKKNTVLYVLKKHKYLHILALIPLAYYLIFKYLPMYGILIAFKDLRHMGSLSTLITAPWVGLDNFFRFFSSIFFKRIMVNTVLISTYRLVFSFPVPILFALLLNEVQNRSYKKFIQTVTYMPHFFSWVIVAGLTSMLLATVNGPVNVLLEQMGRKPIAFLTSPRHFRSVLVLSSIWKEMGWSAIIYLAAIAGIDPELYESAMMDGATRFQQTLHISLPSISPIISMMLILAIGRIFGENFEQIFNLSNAMVYNVSDVFETYIYRVGLVEAKYSYTAAVGFFQSVLSLIMVIAANMAAKKIGAEGIW